MLLKFQGQLTTPPERRPVSQPVHLTTNYITDMIDTKVTDKLNSLRFYSSYSSI